MTLIERNGSNVVNYPPEVNSLYLFTQSNIGPVNYVSDFSIRYVSSGFVDTKVQNKSLRLGRGDLFFVKPQSKVWSLSSAPFTGLSIFLSLDHFLNLHKSAHDPQVPNFFDYSLLLSQPLAKMNFPNLVHYFELLLRTELSPLAGKSIFRNVMSLLDLDIQTMNQRMIGINRRGIITRLELIRKLEEAKAILDREACRKFDLTELSKRVSMSKFALIRDFKELFHQTPQQYAIGQRIQFAMNFLQQGMPVKETAESCGYPDIHSFSKQFRMHLGYPPSFHHRWAALAPTL
jgi:AraC-like DNA-binding protein